MKNNKILDIVINVIVFVILAIILFLTINIIASQGKGYVTIFGKAYAVVRSDSMDGEYGYNGEYSDTWAYKDSVKGFSKGDIVIVDVLSAEEKAQLKVGDVVTYYTEIGGKRVMNTHRIILIMGTGVQTQGDNAFGADSPINFDDIIGKYNGSKIPLIGNFNIFIETTPGFIVCIVVPTAVILIYCIIMLILRIKENNEEKLATEKETLEEKHAQELEEMRKQIMQELMEKNKVESDGNSENSTPVSENEVTPESEADEHSNS